MRGHASIYRATGGWIGGRLPGLPPLLLLDHAGAKSGERRTTPFVYMPEGENLLVVVDSPQLGCHPVVGRLGPCAQRSHFLLEQLVDRRAATDLRNQDALNWPATELRQRLVDSKM